MNLISDPTLTDNDLCVLHDGKRDMVVSPGYAGLAMAVRNLHNPTAKSILVTHPHSGYGTPNSPRNGAPVRTM